MALTAYSIERAGTTYHYSTARSQRDCFTTLHCGEISPLYPTSIYGCRAISEPLRRHISLTASILPPPPPENARRTPSRRLYRGGPSFLSDDPQADATSVRPDGRTLCAGAELRSAPAPLGLLHKGESLCCFRDSASVTYGGMLPSGLTLSALRFILSAKSRQSCLQDWETVDFCNSLPLSYPHTRRASVQAERVPRDLYKRCFFPIYNRSKTYRLINNEYSSYNTKTIWLENQ